MGISYVEASFVGSAARLVPKVEAADYMYVHAERWRVIVLMALGEPHVYLVCGSLVAVPHQFQRSCGGLGCHVFAWPL